MKKRGVSFVELVIYLHIVLIINFFAYSSYIKYVDKNKLEKEIVLITTVFKKYQKYSKINEKEVNIYFDLEKKNIFFDENRVNLNQKYNYKSKNKLDDLKFKRRLNKNGNLSKGFTILIYDSKFNKLAEISFNSVNAMSYPIVSVRKEK